MERAGSITPEGSDFLIAALDPMHDNQLKNLVGWPDVETTASVVRCVKQSLTIKKPDSISGNWDCHVIQYPWLVQQPFVACTRLNNEVVQTSLETKPVFPMGGLSAYSVPAGNDLNLSTVPDHTLTLADNYGKGASRLLGVGIEVVNTTSDLHKQGQAYVWRQPNSRVESTGFNSALGRGDFNARVAFDGLPISCPPLNSQSAMLIPGTRQWRAEDGSYQVVPHVGQDNPPALVNYTQPVVHMEPVDDTPRGASATALAPSSFNTSTVAVPVPFIQGTDVAFAPFNIYPIHQTGAIYAGLSAETSLTLTWNVFIETFPTVADPDILVLATPSAEYDPMALMMYSHALNTLPVGVPSDWNGFGDWFADVVSTVTDFITPGAMALGMPAIAGISAASGRLAKGYLAKKDADSKKAYLTAPGVANTDLAETKALLQKAINQKGKQKQQKQKQKQNQKGPAGRGGKAASRRKKQEAELSRLLDEMRG